MSSIYYKPPREVFQDAKKFTCWAAALESRAAVIATEFLLGSYLPGVAPVSAYSKPIGLSGCRSFGNSD